MDFSYLNAVSDGDHAFIQQFIDTFQTTASSLVTSMRSSLKDDDLAQLRSDAHQLKPSLEMLQLTSHGSCLAINNDPSSATAEMIDEIEKDSIAAIAAMKEHFGL